MNSRDLNFFCENDTLKKVLACNEISTTLTGNNAVAKTLSTLIADHIVLYSINIELELLENYSRSNNYDTLIQLIVNVPNDAPVKIIDLSGNLRDGVVSDLSNKDLGLIIKWSIPFANFLSIKGINGSVPFSVIDENFNIPTELMNESRYISNSNIKISTLEKAFSKIDKSIKLEDDDDFFSTIEEITEKKNTKKVSKKNRKFISKENKLNASLLIAVNTCKELDRQNNITASSYFILENKKDFGSYIKKEFYNWLDDDTKNKMSIVDELLVCFMDGLKKVVKIKNDKNKKFDNLLEIVMYHFLNSECEKYSELDFEEIYNKINDEVSLLEYFDVHKFNNIMSERNSRDVLQSLTNNCHDKMIAITYFFKMFYNKDIESFSNTITAFNISNDLKIVINGMYGLLYGMYMVPKEHKKDKDLNDVTYVISKKMAGVKDYSIVKEKNIDMKYLKCNYPIMYVNILLENTYLNKHKIDLTKTIETLKNYQTFFVSELVNKIKFNDFIILLETLNDPIKSKRNTKEILASELQIHKAYEYIIKNTNNKKNKQLSLFEGE